LSQRISRSPYDPVLWHERGALLLKLGYPDLAMGDLYKCKLLCEDGLSTNTDNSQRAARRLYVQKAVHQRLSPTPSTSSSTRCDISALLNILPAVIEALGAVHESGSTHLISAMMRAKCFQDIIDLSQELAAQYPANVDFLNQQVLAAHQLKMLAENSKLKCDEALMASRFGSVYRRIYPWMKKIQYKCVWLKYINVVANECQSITRYSRNY
jgi:hypothetical protein